MTQNQAILATVEFQTCFILHFQGNDIDSFVSPICLPLEKTDPGHSLVNGDRLVVTGWGKVTNNISVSYDVIIYIFLCP